MNTMVHQTPLRSPVGLAAILLLMVLIAGCAGLAAKGRVEKFNEIAESYQRALEMSAYHKALRFIDSDAAQPVLPLESYANFKIVGYDVTRIQVSEDKRSIEQDVKLEYFQLNRNVIKTANDHQVWVYKDEGKVWMLQTGLPVLVN